MKKNVASQKLDVFAFADAGHATLDAGEPVTGDSAQITMKIAKDDGTRTASDDTNPTETEDGVYQFDLTQAETNADKLAFYPESSTAGVQVVAMPSRVIYARPQYFPDLGIESDGDLTKVNTCDTNTDMRGTDSAFLAANAPSNFSSLGINVSGHVSRVTLCDTTTANTDMRGTDDALLASSITVNGSGHVIVQDYSMTATKFGSNWLQAGQIASGAFNDKGNWLLASTWNTLMSGITSLAAWLGVLAGKTADASTLAEVQATTGGTTYDNTTDSPEAIRDNQSAGGGDATAANQTTIIDHLTDIKDDNGGTDFDSSTDSLEAIRHRGDAAWVTGGSGSGARTVLISVSDGTNLIPNAIVSIQDSAGNSLSISARTSSSGVATFNLDDGNYQGLVAQLSRYATHTAEAFTVDEDGEAVTLTITASAGSGTDTGWLG